MAEGLLRELLPLHDVYSAGLSTLEGSPADRIAIELMWQSGIDISEHRSRNLASWMMREADLVFTMDSAQTQFVIRRYPIASKKVERLGEPCDLDIPDPYQHGLAAFCHALRLIERAVQIRLPALNRSTSCLVH
jgi:protein-tyrosine phosphatase